MYENEVNMAPTPSDVIGV